MDRTPTTDRSVILRDAELVDVAVNCITVEHRVNCRTSIDPSRVKLLTRAIFAGSDIGELVIADVEGTLTLIDGYHRYQALITTETQSIGALKLPGSLTLQEAQWVAFALHWKAERPLSSKERKEGFKAFIKADGHVKVRTSQGRKDRYKSYREIGAELGFSHQTIFNWMSDLFPRIAEAMGREATEADKPTLCRKERALKARLQAITHYSNQIANLSRTGEEATEHAREALSKALGKLGVDLTSAEVSSQSEYDFT